MRRATRADSARAGRSVSAAAAAAGNGSSATVANGADIQTAGTSADGVLAQSIGGGGGYGGFSYVGQLLGSLGIGLGSTADGGGTSGLVTVSNGFDIATTGSDADDIAAQSIGGGGGQGGFSISAAANTDSTSKFAGLSFALGSNGGAGGNSGNVVVNDTSGAQLTTTGTHADGILAQSVGGGGGDGGFSVATNATSTYGLGLSLGGAGGSGGSAGTVGVTNAGAIGTLGDFSNGIFAQSVGGGGGTGAFAVIGGVTTSVNGQVAIGGAGAGAGNAGAVTVGNSGLIVTQGQQAMGIDAESIGGGGGSGGFSVASSLTTSSGTGVSIGGTAGGGGNGAGVTVTNSGNIETTGATSHGIYAESVGGGGGSGGFSVAGGVTGGGALGLALGASGGTGGNGGNVVVNNTATGTILANGFHSDGVFAQSVGGGGGDAGFSVAGSVSSGSGLNVALGGSGGTGGIGGTVGVTNAGTIVTNGAFSSGVFAQSVGGGGGAGGFAIAGGVPSGSAGLSTSIGGHGGTGTVGGAVTVTNTGQIGVTGADSYGIFAQSVGGGGGVGGFSGALSAGLSGGTQAAVGVGGSGGNGADGGSVTVTNSGNVATTGAGDNAFFAQSIGGGGGDAGLGLGLSLGTPELSSLGLGVGGSGTNGVSGAVSITNTGTLQTMTSDAFGMLVQSIGGGGGNGGYAASGSLQTTPAAHQLSVNVGGSGGIGNNGAAVGLKETGNVGTFGNDAPGVAVQSIGGGGGNGMMDFTGSFSAGTPTNVGTAVGGNGAGGGNGAAINLTDVGTIVTGSQTTKTIPLPDGGVPGGPTETFVTGDTGDRSTGLLLQSIGGGGGIGSLGLLLTPATGTEQTGQIGVTVGGKNGATGSGGTVALNENGTVMTFGDDADGIELQSIGGGGGNGAAAIAGTTPLGTTQALSTYNLGIAVGGNGGTGSAGGTVTLTRNGNVGTTGNGSIGLLAQSIGGGGGSGGSARSASTNLATTCGNLIVGCDLRNTGLAVTIGGSGFGTNNGGAVAVNDGTYNLITPGLLSQVTTSGEDASAIVAQSIGGGGGIGGDADVVTPQLPGVTNAKSYLNSWNLAVGGSAGSSGNGGAVTVVQSGYMATTGDGSDDVFAQSVGGGGGAGGAGVGNGTTGAIKVGGTGGATGNGGAVTVNLVNATPEPKTTPPSRTQVQIEIPIMTQGNGAMGIFAQSVGGGGGVAGNLDTGLSTTTFAETSSLMATGGGGGNGGAVTVNALTYLDTFGAGADGIFAQSVGGGGGLAGSTNGTAFGFAGSAGGAGSGGAVSVNFQGDLKTFGAGADGIFAQSDGGTGKGGNVNVTVNGDVIADGPNADGVYAQSHGAGGNGNISVTVGVNSIVQGGGLSSAGVRIVDGSKNTLTNYGLITASVFDETGPGPIEPGDIAVSPGTGGVATSIATSDVATVSATSDTAAVAATAAAPATGTIAATTPQIVGRSAGVAGSGTGRALSHAGDASATIANDPSISAPASSTTTETSPQIIGRSAGVAGDGTTVGGALTTQVVGRSSEGNDGSATLATAAQSATSGAEPAPASVNLSALNDLMHYQDDPLGLAKVVKAPVKPGSSLIAVWADAGTLTVNNYGSIVGQIDLNGAKGIIHNYGTIVPGADALIGGGTLENDGIMSLGGGVSVADSKIEGSFSQTAAADDLVDLNLRNNTADHLTVAGTAALSGTVALQLLNMNGAAPGSYKDTLVTADGGITSHDGLNLSLPKSAIATFDLTYPDASSLQLDYTIDYAPRTGQTLGTNDVAFGSYLGRIQTAGSTPSLAPVMTMAFALPDLPSLQKYYARLDPSGTLAASSNALQTNLDFSSAMLGCKNGDGNHLVSNTNCSWGSLGAESGNQKAGFGSVGYSQSMTGVSTGFQRTIGNGSTLVGAALQYHSGALDADAGQALTGDTVDVGILAKHRIDAKDYVSASIVGGTENFESTRSLDVASGMTTATGNQRTTYVGAHLRAERAIDLGSTSITPYVDLGATHVGTSALDDSGAGALDVHVAPHAELYTTAQTGVSLSMVKQWASTTLRPAIDLSATELIGNAQSGTTASLDGSPAGVAPFALSNNLDRTRFNIGPSISISRGNKLDVKIGGTYDVSAGAHDFSGYVQIGTKI